MEEPAAPPIESLPASLPKLKQRIGKEFRLPKTKEVDPAEQQVILERAKAILAKREEERRKRLSKTAEDVGVVYYIECHRCGGPGIFFFGDPNVELEPSSWEATYKPRSIGWPKDSIPHCQCCLADGKTVPLRMFTSAVGTPGPFQKVVGVLINPRFLREIPREDYEQLAK
jgi:hypothetical protein